MKKVYLILITVLTIFCIIGGTVYHVAGFACDILPGVKLAFDNKRSGAADVDNEKTGAFSSVALEANAINVTVEQGKDYALKYEGSDSLRPSYDLSDGVLTVRQRVTDKKSWIGLSGHESELTITVPEGTALDSLRIDNKAGNIKADGIVTGDADISVNAGNVDVDGCTINGTGKIQLNAGNAELHDTVLKEIDISNNMGNITVEGLKNISDYTVDASADLGNVDVGSGSYRGECHIDGKSGMTIKASTNMGNVEISQ